MTGAPNSIFLQKTDLGVLKKMGEGGQGNIYLVNDFRIPGHDGPLVYKQYKKSILRDHGTAISNGMPPLIRFPDSLSDAERGFLQERSVWPKALVLDGKQALGILMKIIPDAFFFDMTKPSGTERKLLELQHFYRTDAQKRALGIPVLDDKDKIRAVFRMVRAIEFFHRRGLVLGDFSPANVALSHPQKLDGANRGKVFPKFLDIDSFRFHGGQPPVEQANTPGWYAPETHAAEKNVRRLKSDGASFSEIMRADAQMKNLNTRTDVFKFGLAVLRMFDSSDDAIAVYISTEASQRITKVVGSRTAKVLLASLEEKPENRPTMTEILQQFQSQGS